ncbi:MAG TPA: ATP-binding protein [Dissulfurispiraceae bacterium]
MVRKEPTAADEGVLEADVILRKRVRLCCIALPLLNLAFIPVYYYMSGVFPFVAKLLFGVLAISAAGYALSYEKRVPPGILSLVVLIACACLHTSVLALTGGSKSPYFPFLLLYIAGASMLFPWEMKYPVVAFTSILALYVGSVLGFDKAIDYEEFMVNGMVIVLISVLGISRTHLWERLRGREFRMRLMHYRERENLCRSLHDSLSSDLFNITLLSDIEKVHLREHEAAARLSLISETSRRGLENIRDFLFSADKEGPSVGDLLERMHDYGNRLLENSRIKFAVTKAVHGKPCRLPPLHSFDIFLIYKEALMNVIKHAKAGRVHVLVNTNSKELEMIIEDDGIGFDPAGPLHEQYGLSNMRARAGEIGGTLAVQSKPGRGTRITLAVSFG